MLVAKSNKRDVLFSGVNEIGYDLMKFIYGGAI